MMLREKVKQEIDKLSEEHLKPEVVYPTKLLIEKVFMAIAERSSTNDPIPIRYKRCNREARIQTELWRSVNSSIMDN